ncbi:MAG: transglycosylase domain-containing protein [Akkermansia sp.]|nr:transglycosylase domain-containing protein [Akkermansia sp.]
MDDLDEYQNRRKAAEERRRIKAARKEPVARKGSRWKRFLLRVFIVMFVFLLVCAVGGYVGFNIFTAKYQKWADEFDLEDINNLDHPCIIYDRNGEEIGRIFDENRSYVTYDKISRSMIDALVAQEDKTFWTHNGFDPIGIIRAARAAVSSGEANQGASTVTQQLARNAYDLERRTQARGGSRYERKIVEIFLAMRIEKKYDKRQIMEFYLNRIYFGRGYYGIRAASLGYFGKEPADLTVRESASIAALIKNPENYNPIRNFDLNFKWRNDVIDRMQRLNYLTLAEAERLKKLPMTLNPKPLSRQTSHLHAVVQQLAIDLFQDPVRGEEIVKSAGLKVYTTIDKRMQEAAENALVAQLDAIESRKDYQHVKFADKKHPDASKHRYLDGSVYAVDNKTGATLVYVAGRSFSRDNYDFIELGRRPVGTALLPFLYMCAFDNGYTPCSRLVDDALDNRLAGIGGTEGILGEWGMEVSKGRYLDSVTARQALCWSKIAASARLGIALASDAKVAARPFVTTLTNVGITPPPRNPNSTEARPLYYPRAYLGTEPMSLKEMVLAYTVFPNCGKRPVVPYIVSKVTDSNGKVLWQNPHDLTRRQVKSTTPCTAFRLHSIMKQSLQEGSAARVRPYLPDNFKGAVKSGSNYDFSDTTLFGYDADVTCGVWMGFLNDHHAIYPEAFASDTCAPVLGAVFKAGQGRFPNADIAPPDDTEEVEICLSSGHLATNFCFESTMKDGKPVYERPTYREFFPKGDVTLGMCSVHGDGSPSLGDFLELTSSNTGSSRVLPVVPVLPKAAALVGEDPYGCITTLNPRYKSADDLVQSGSSTAEEVNLTMDDVAEDTEQEAIDNSIQLTPPRPMRIMPVMPLPF